MNILPVQIANLKQQVKMIEQEIKRLEIKDDRDRFDKLKEALKNSGPLQITDVCEFDNRLYASLAISEFEKIENILPIALEVGYSETNKNIICFEKGVQSNTIAFNSLVECAKALEIQIDWASGIEIIECRIRFFNESLLNFEKENPPIFKEDLSEKEDYENILNLLKIEQNKQLLSDWAKRNKF